MRKESQDILNSITTPFIIAWRSKIFRKENVWQHMAESKRYMGDFWVVRFFKFARSKYLQTWFAKDEN